MNPPLGNPQAASERKHAKLISWTYALILSSWILIQSGLPYTLIADIELSSHAWRDLLVGWFITSTSAWLLYLMLTKYQALINHDPLTGLPNRHLLHDRIIQAIAQADRSGHLFAVAFIDLDNFKLINNSLGHTAGDHLLKAIAESLQATIRPVDTLARLGGDEFILILQDLPNEKFIADEIERINQAFSAPFFIDNREIFVTYSAGFSLYPQDGRNTETLLMNADVAMYRAKEQSGNSFQFYAPEMHAKINDRLLLESTMRHALESGEFRLIYQPQINLKTRKIFGMEALIRWDHPSMGTLPPDTFISLAEDIGLIVPIGEWAIKAACLQLKEFRNEGLHDLIVAVNISGRQLKESHLIASIGKILEETGIAAESLELELTESILMDHSESLLNTLDQLKSMGLKLAIDDFGTGYSSLSYLKRFPMDKLKIDQSFVKDIGSGGDDAAIVQAIIHLGHSLHLRVIAEGIESKAQMDFLTDNHCDEGQGFYYNRPLTAEEFKAFVVQQRQQTP